MAESRKKGVACVKTLRWERAWWSQSEKARRN